MKLVFRVKILFEKSQIISVLPINIPSHNYAAVYVYVEKKAEGLKNISVLSASTCSHT